ncbi:extracellular solute-binding protein [Paralcaligenes sp. KSB-10]|uniref:ABC transporter substrate-binding protein n=1 Tax=Paralcaligenes sp. KSB-10 TaxID=2901142 RepID=UPI001E4D41C4|nr:extracellular solute-binding protein [Paralcaligenes sp. KSB-10]UHL64801.1 extracellular solute-binding protein [Paralcaligenes sp. KSB-10]
MSTNKETRHITRRDALQAGLALAALPLSSLLPKNAVAQTRPVTKVLNFTTGADIAKAEKEGEFLFYTHDSEPAAAGIIEAFTKDFPKIKGKYVRAQNGALFSKILAERSAGRYDADVIQFSEPSTALDFQKRGGYQRYLSPQADAYDPGHLSSPAGDYFWVAVGFAGLAYNSNLVKAADAPKTWKDVLNPIWKNSVSAKQSTSGMQFAEWYELRRLYGDDFWKQFAKLRPRGFDSRAQVFDRLSKGDDKLCVLAEYAGYMLVKDKGAPVTFVAPSDGLPAAPMLNGIVDKAPHPEAARLFVDWLMSIRGQTHYQNNKYLYYGSVRKDAPPMPGGERLRDFKLLVPTDMANFTASHGQFMKEWNSMLGL